MRTKLYGIAFASLALSMSAQAAIIYQSQNRFVQLSGSSNDQPVDEQIHAVGFDPFNDTISDYRSSASQNSVLNATSMQATGTASGAMQPPVGSQEVGGRTHFEVTFDISEPTPYVLDLSPGSTSFVEFGSYSFTGPSLDIEGTSIDGLFPVVHSDGVLQPGQYHFIIDVSVGGASEGLISSFDFSATIPAPASGVLVALGPIVSCQRRRRS